MFKLFLSLAMIYPLALSIYYYIRKTKEGESISIANAVMVFLTKFCFSFMYFSLLAFFIIRPISTQVFGKTYNGIVIGSQGMDSSDSSAEAVQAIVQFTDDKGQQLQKPLNYGSSIIIPEGTHLRIAYVDGEDEIANLDVSTQLLPMFAVLLFAVVLGIAMVVITNSALGIRNGTLQNMGIQFVIYLIVPSVVIFFIAIIIEIVKRSLNGGKDFPIGSLIFFGILLAPLIPLTIRYYTGKFNLTPKKPNQSK